MCTHAALSLLLLGALTLGMPAQAGTPLQTEDAGVLARGDCELEGTRLRVGSEDSRSREQGLSSSCGVGSDSQVGLGLSARREGGAFSRLAQIGGKTGLWRAAGEDAAALSVAWAVGEAQREPHHWLRSTASAQLVASLPAGDQTVHLNVGHARDRMAGQDSTTWHAAVEHESLSTGEVRWAPMAELFGDDRSAPWWSLALRVTVAPEHLFLHFSWGRQARSGTPTLATAGFKVAF